MTSKKVGAIALLLLTALMAVVFFLLPPIPQPQAYHHFFDERSFCGIHNFANVVSNLPFAVVGIWGLAFLIRGRSRQTVSFLDQRERRPYLFVFAGLLFTAFGSSYYHLNPTNARLVWDRLPMTIVFMAMVAAVITERISLRAGLWLLPVLLLVGLGSVFQWYSSELRGAGDLRLYALVQIYSALVLLIALLFPPKYTRGFDLAVVLGFYVLAKIFEILDKDIFSAGRIVSGHTIKHLSAAAAGYWILRMLQRRKPLSHRSLVHNEQP
jgi:hypothetical protein